MLMLSRTTLTIAATSLLAVAALAPPAQAEVRNFNMDAAYSATRIIEGGEQRMEQRYFQQDATTYRMEMHAHGQHSTIIMNGDRGVMWILMPSQQMYMESSIDDQRFDATNVELPDPETWEMERVGRESVNGVSATKYRVATDSGETTRMQGFLWISDDGIPVRTDMVTGGDRIQMELRDLVMGRQPAELFEPPAGYQRFALGDDTNSGMSDLMRGAMGGAATTPVDGDPEPGFVGELATGATEEAKRATKDEVRDTVNDAVRKGLRGLLRGQ